SIGDDLRMDYTAQGHTVGLAQRMEQLAEPRSIYLTEHTAKLVGGYFHLRDLGLSRIKGVSDALHVYELEGLGALGTRLEVSRARGFSKFVGRTDEVATLEAALARALAGQGQVVGVVADAGVGKSRLCFEFLERCRARNITVTEGRAVAHGKNIPFLPMLQVFRAYYGITEQDTDRAAREKIAGRLLLIDESFREVLPLLFEFFAVPDPERPAPPMDPEERQRQLFGVLRRLVQQGNQQQLIVTLLEDLHWIDAGSEAFLAQWVDAIAPAHGLLLLNFRPEYRADWMRKSYYQQLPLVPLGPEAIDELFRDLLGTDASIAPLAARIRERTAGNPFFIEEMVQSLAETGALVGSRGAFRLERPADTFAIPATVQAILAARIDRLSERDKSVLQTAAAIGREFSEPLLRRVLFPPFEKGGPGGISSSASQIPPSTLPRRGLNPPLPKGEEELSAALRALTEAEFLYEQSLYPVAEYAFKHPLTQEVAYGSQLAERRRRTHAAVAVALEDAEASKLDEHAALIAHHWEAAGEDLIAARWHLRAALWAANSDLAASHQHWRTVRELASKLPEVGEARALRLSACVQLVNLGWRLATPRDETDARFAEGQEIAARAGDLRSQAMLFSNYSLIAFNDDLSRALECHLEANRLADQLGNLGLRVAVGCMLAPLLFAGRLRQALQRAEEVMALTGSDPSLAADVMHFSPYLWLRTLRGHLLFLLGQPREGRSDLEGAAEQAERFPTGITRAVVYIFCTDGCYFAADVAAALHYGRLAIEAAERSGSNFYRMMARGSLGAAHALNGDWDEARLLLEEARSIAGEFRLVC
ncbi:MAG TPA: AAA family ATPase, partial [Candidatus Margulisiibacteriota bacterium]|nr:AAA family ATPase [Candidatus Margulisiibacteriota bacterium]